MTEMIETTASSQLTRADAEEFVYDEVALLDAGRYRDWLELFAEDGVYWVPSNELDHDPDRHVSIIYDTRVQLADRITRLELGRVVQELPSRTLHLVGNVRLRPDGSAGGEQRTVDVAAAMSIHEVHRDRAAVHPAHCHYRLRPTSHGWRIGLKKVALLDNDQYFGNLAYLL